MKIWLDNYDYMWFSNVGTVTFLHIIKENLKFVKLVHLHRHNNVYMYSNSTVKLLNY